MVPRPSAVSTGRSQIKSLPSWSEVFPGGNGQMKNTDRHDLAIRYLVLAQDEIFKILTRIDGWTVVSDDDDGAHDYGGDEIHSGSPCFDLRRKKHCLILTMIDDQGKLLDNRHFIGIGRGLHRCVSQTNCPLPSSYSCSPTGPGPLTRSHMNTSCATWGHHYRYIPQMTPTISVPAAILCQRALLASVIDSTLSPR